jgi:hypothetical protein
MKRLKRNSRETEEQKRLRKLEEELAKERQARVKSELINKATTLATQKGLPVELVAYFVGQDEDSTVNNLTALENIWQQHLQKAVEEKFKESGRSPNSGGEAAPARSTPGRKRLLTLLNRAGY